MSGKKNTTAAKKTTATKKPATNGKSSKSTGEKSKEVTRWETTHAAFAEKEVLGEFGPLCTKGWYEKCGQALNRYILKKIDLINI